MSASGALPITIRPAETSDAEAACAVLRRSITELCQQDYLNQPGRLDRWLANKTPDQVKRWIEDTSLAIYLALRNDDLAGVACLSRDDKVLLNYVDPNHRLMGVSSALLSHMEQAATSRGANMIKLESTKTAYRFYEARGYQPDPTNDDKSHLWMIKKPD
ncbi:MAG: GNAT family N-acetyltransferase [Cohaesibacteraceae bacterium]